LSLFEGLFEVTNHVEGSLGVNVSLSCEKGLESFDGLVELDELSRNLGEDLRHVEGLRQKPLDLSGSGDCELVLF
jgi:hypothetical protein